MNKKTLLDIKLETAVASQTIAGHIMPSVK